MNEDNIKGIILGIIGCFIFACVFDWLKGNNDEYSIKIEDKAIVACNKEFYPSEYNGDINKMFSNMKEECKDNNYVLLHFDNVGKFCNKEIDTYSFIHDNDVLDFDNMMTSLNDLCDGE